MDSFIAMKNSIPWMGFEPIEMRSKCYEVNNNRNHLVAEAPLKSSTMTICDALGIDHVCDDREGIMNSILG